MSKTSRKFQVPDTLANLYDFANSLDVRHFVHHGVQHAGADELGDAASLGNWLARHSLNRTGKVPSVPTFEAALALRGVIRDYLERQPAERRREAAWRDALDKAIEMNGVSIRMNREAFAWGRLAAHDLAMVERIAGLGSHVAVTLPVTCRGEARPRAAVRVA